MKILQVKMQWSASQITMIDDAKADAAYKAIKEAIEAYDRYGNDKAKTVTIQDDHGEHTYIIEHLTAVGIEDAGVAGDDALVQIALRRDRLEAKISAAKAGMVLPQAAE